MTRRPAAGIAVLAVTVAAGLAAAPALGDPAGKTTLEETITMRGGEGRGIGYRTLVAAPGERHLVRTELARPRSGRANRRRSLAFFAQLTDPQLADEMSPVRADFADPAGGNIAQTHRPQEALGAHVLDHIVRNVNANRTSPVRGSGGRAKLQFAIATGDLSDSHQLNETQWIRSILDGDRVTPFSGKPISESNPCRGASPEEVAQINAGVANREYVGVQDYDDYPGVPADRYGGFWDPDRAPPQRSPLYPGFPRYPGLLDRAQQPFEPQGLKVPWYTAFGNHDGLIQGIAPSSSAMFRSLVTGCLKILPSATFNPATLVGLSLPAVFGRLTDPSFLNSLFAGAKRIAPDPDRRYLSVVEHKQVLGSDDDNHGFGFVDRNELRASRGNASYYAFSPRPDVRMIVLDTVATGGGTTGQVDDPQYRWLERELDRSSSRHITPGGRMVRDGDRDRLIVLFSHHTLATMDNDRPAEAAGECSDPMETGCDSDPRRSTPIHLGLTGPEHIRDLLLRHPNVIAFVNGHTHQNQILPFRRRDGRAGFWQVNTASHVDWSQQSRLVEIFDNRDGTLSVFGTLVDSAAPVQTPREGTLGRRMTGAQLASISRRVAASDPQRFDVTSFGGRGNRRDRNVELLIRDPRRR